MATKGGSIRQFEKHKVCRWLLYVVAGWLGVAWGRAAAFLPHLYGYPRTADWPLCDTRCLTRLLLPLIQQGSCSLLATWVIADLLRDLNNRPDTSADKCLHLVLARRKEEMCGNKVGDRGELPNLESRSVALPAIFWFVYFGPHY